MHSSMQDPTDPEGCDASALATTLETQHRRFEEELDRLRHLVHHLQANGPDDRARIAAASVLAVFDAEAPAHRAAEEQRVLTVLRRAGGTAGAVLAAKLEAEHGLIERAWGQCRQALVELAGSGRWAAESAAFEYERWRDFAALATAHMLAEHGAAFPMVLALLGDPGPLA